MNAPLSLNLFNASEKAISDRAVAKRVAVAGDEIALAVFDVGQGAEAVNLQLEDEVAGVEWFRPAGEPHGAQVSREHNQIIYIRYFSFVSAFIDALRERSAQ